jgi:hypothetical protein
MAFPSVTNVDGSNPGPNSTVLPDTVQMPTGNIWKSGVFNLTLAPVTIASSTTAEQTFAATGIGLITTDWVWVTSSQTNNGVGIVNARVSAYDTLNITWVNPQPTAGTPSTTASYSVFVVRVQPNWVKPSSGNQLDW